MSHDPTEGAGAFAPDNARQLIETASAYAQREMLPEARQALQRARSALAQRSDVGPAHWCNACLVALEIAARGGDVQGMESEAAQLRSLSGGGQYWAEQARARIGKSSGRVDPARLDRVFAVLAGSAAPAPASAPPDAAPRVSALEGRGLIAPTARPSARPEADPGLLPVREEEPAPPPARAEAPGPPALPAPNDPGRVYRGAAWGGASWSTPASEEPSADRLPAESVSASAPEGDPAPYFPEDSGNGWMDRLAELADIADDDLPLIFVHDGGGEAGPIDTRLRVTPERTDAEELLRSFVDHMTRWRDDVSDEEAENFYDLGTSFLDMEQWESAVKVFDQAMRNPGTRVAAAEGYLRALMGMGDHHAAFGAAGMALGNLAAAGEPLSGILFLRGQAAERIGDPREARRCYREALLIDRFFADARARLAALGE